jgi:hypothetical protein
MRSWLGILLLLNLPAICQQISPQAPAEQQPALKQRTELPGNSPGPGQPHESPSGLWIVSAGTKIPIQLRQAVSTKNAQPGDPIYAQTTFPIVQDGIIMIPAGTYVKGVVDNSKRAGRIKGRAELQFHLTTLIYPNGYTLELAAAIDQVPGSSDSHMKEPGTVTHDAQKGEDIGKIGDAAEKGAIIGSVAGSATRSLGGFGVGGISGIAAGTLIALLARGGDVRFEIGSGVEVSLNHAIGIDGGKVMKAGMLPASNPPAPVIAAPLVSVEK